MSDTEYKIEAGKNTETVMTENAAPAAEAPEENMTENAAPVAEKPKKKKGPEFRSNEYSVWRYIIYVVLAFGGGQVVGGVFGSLFTTFLPVFFEGGLFYSIKDSANIIIAFFFNFIIAVLLIKPILHTTFKSLVTGNRKYKAGYALVCVAIYVVAIVVSMLISADTISYNPADTGLRIACLLFVLILVPFQTTTEEIIFRMTLGRLFMKNKVLKSVPMMLLASLISGLIFFVPHLLNPEVREYGLVVAIFSYFGVGFALMLMSCIVGSFEGAIAVHAINNIWSMMICTEKVSAASFNSFFIDNGNDPLLMCGTLTVLYSILIIWSIIYRKKHKLAEE